MTKTKSIVFSCAWPTLFILLTCLSCQRVLARHTRGDDNEQDNTGSSRLDSATGTVDLPCSGAPMKTFEATAVLDVIAYDGDPQNIVDLIDMTWLQNHFTKLYDQKSYRSCDDDYREVKSLSLESNNEDDGYLFRRVDNIYSVRFRMTAVCRRCDPSDYIVFTLQHETDITNDVSSTRSSNSASTVHITGDGEIIMDNVKARVVDKMNELDLQHLDAASNQHESEIMAGKMHISKQAEIIESNEQNEQQDSVRKNRRKWRRIKRKIWVPSEVPAFNAGKKLPGEPGGFPPSDDSGPSFDFSGPFSGEPWPPSTADPPPARGQMSAPSGSPPSDDPPDSPASDDPRDSHPSDDPGSSKACPPRGKKKTPEPTPEPTKGKKTQKNQKNKIAVVDMDHPTSPPTPSPTPLPIIMPSTLPTTLPPDLPSVDPSTMPSDLPSILPSVVPSGSIGG